MKNTFIFALLLSSACIAAPLKGITENGDEVLLRDDGTWSYLNPEEVETEKIEINPVEFTTPRKSSFPVKSSKNNFSVLINPKEWTFKKSDEGVKEFVFEFKGYDIYGMMINESLQMELESLAVVALENARAAAPDTQIIQKEYRIVNGHKVIFMEMAGTISGLKVTYLGYYYSDESGMTQLIAYTGTSAVDQYRSKMEEFLNGFVVRDK